MLLSASINTQCTVNLSQKHPISLTAGLHGGTSQCYEGCDCSCKSMALHYDDTTVFLMISVK